MLNYFLAYLLQDLIHALVLLSTYLFVQYGARFLQKLLYFSLTHQRLCSLYITLITYYSYCKISRGFLTEVFKPNSFKVINGITVCHIVNEDACVGIAEVHLSH